MVASVLGNEVDAWRDPSAETPATIEVRFEATVGCTSYDVVRVKSVVYPCCLPVRMIVDLSRSP